MTGSAGSGRYRILVPTRNSARWVGAFYRAYRRLGIDPLYMVDTRSNDGTGELLRELGANILPVAPKHDRVEVMLELARDACGDEWVIRFDDDELPSSRLIAWLNRHIGSVQEACLAMSRRDVLMHDGRLCFSRMELYYFHPRLPTYLDPQWRGFVPSQVKFTGKIHTPGFEFPSYTDAPETAYFVHFDWMLRSRAERMEKLRRYERQSPGGGWGFAQYYLPELHSPETARWTPIGTDEFDPLIAEFPPAAAGFHS